MVCIPGLSIDRSAMSSLDAFFAWVSGREQILSGLAALVVIAGVFLSPLGHGVRMLVARRGPAPEHATKIETQSAPIHPDVVLDRPSLAVLPFDNMSDDRALEFAADGLSDDIIVEMSRDRRLFVVARNSSFAYKGKSPNLRTVGRELGVQFVLEGRLRRVGEAVRVTAQLIDARSGAHVWSDTLDRADGDLVTAQDQFGHHIATALTSHFIRDESQDAARAKPESLQAWELSARAASRWAAGQNNKRSYDDMVSLLKLAAEKYPDDPDVLAMAGSTGAFAWLYDPAVDFVESSKAARIAIERALALAPGNPAYIGTHGSFLVWTGKPRLAVPILRRAIGQLPNDDQPTRINLAYALLFSGCFSEALTELDSLSRAGLPDMLRGVYDLARADIELALDNYPESERCAREAIGGAGANAWSWITLALALAATACKKAVPAMLP